jgi:hypothetical protein
MLNQLAGDVPAAVPDRVAERGADRRAGCLDVGTAVDERLGHVDVVAADRPVQRRSGAVPPSDLAFGSAPACMNIRVTAGPSGKYLASQWPRAAACASSPERPILAGAA